MVWERAATLRFIPALPPYSGPCEDGGALGSIQSEPWREQRDLLSSPLRADPQTKMGNTYTDRTIGTLRPLMIV